MMLPIWLMVNIETAVAPLRMQTARSGPERKKAAPRRGLKSNREASNRVDRSHSEEIQMTGLR
jgi:hypothetical protein